MPLFCRLSKPNQGFLVVFRNAFTKVVHVAKEILVRYIPLFRLALNLGSQGSDLKLEVSARFSLRFTNEAAESLTGSPSGHCLSS